MKLKIFFVLFGCGLGLAAALLFRKIYFSHKRRGVEFNSVADFRGTITDSKDIERLRRADGTLPFVAVIATHPSDEIIYTLKPNFDDLFTGVRVKTNSLGMRSPERPAQKAQDVYRIALLGDSFAFGWGVEQPEIFAQVLENDLNKDAPQHKKFEVINMGVPGYSTFQESSLFLERGLQFQPDAVLVFLVHNDFDFSFFIKSNSNSQGLIDVFTMGSKRDLAARQKQQREELIAKGLDPNATLIKLGATLSQKQIPLLVTINPRKDWRKILKKLPVLSENSAVKFLPIGNEFEDIVAKNKYTDAQLNLPHDPHPTALRHHIYGDLLAKELESTILH